MTLTYLEVQPYASYLPPPYAAFVFRLLPHPQCNQTVRTDGLLLTLRGQVLVFLNGTWVDAAVQQGRVLDAGDGWLQKNSSRMAVWSRGQWWW
ncbi:hypothetical protein SERLADRAFT_375965 [Serpula lacrymans var. lacrymans S7.9]|uniref:Uncharacterized protein n=1 Tax=Serpula lacrymans var. lacrymans (strain S7.9) TaxID=578457 RepID=F8NCZ8_SERL9|nr:uncharacterized protein SERLADRAFT_375965 [Serpula lacrymans var. lacrymans S7.9]EGO30742.1 hypothetical protein SERLADRAFT_375965 [Serpula lacrymans var. lacrymans S7.9]